MKSEPLKRPRRAGKHVSAAIDLLTDAGATDVTVTKTRHLQIRFMVGDRPFVVRQACTPKNADDSESHFRQAVARALERAIRERDA